MADIINKQSLLNDVRASLEDHGHIVMTADQLRALSNDDVQQIREAYGASHLMRLPENEVAFFEWLRANDEAVWKDLWADTAEAPYLVSLAHLETFSGKEADQKFHIRDLQTVDNYFFTPDMLLEKESTDFLAAVRSRLEDSASLTLHQAFALHVSVGPIDVWHFAYENKRPLDAVKKAVSELVDDRILVHVPKADHLTDHFDVD